MLPGRYVPFVVKCVIFVMIFSMISPAMPAVFAEESGNGTTSVTNDTYGENASNTISQDTYGAPVVPVLHVPSQDPMAIFNTATSVTSVTYATYTINYSVLNPSTGKEYSTFNPSNQNADKPGRLIVGDDGTYTFSFRGLNAYLFSDVSAMQDGETSPATVTEETYTTADGDKKYTRISVKLVDLDQPITLNYTFGGITRAAKLVLDRSSMMIEQPVNETPPTIPPVTPTDPELVTPAQGTEQSISFQVLKDGSTDVSMMDSYMQKPAKLVTTADHKRYIQLGVNYSSQITELQTEVKGAFIPVGTIAKDQAANTRVIQFSADELSTSNSLIAAKVHVVMPMGAQVYDNWYTVTFAFDGANLAPTYANGSYQLSYNVLKATSDTASSMANYFTTPAVFRADNGKYDVSFTVKSSSVVTSLKTMVNGSLVEAETVSEDTSSNERTVRFRVGNLDDLLSAQVHVKATPTYEADYPIRFQFDSSSLKSITTSPEAPAITDGEYDVKFAVYKDGSNENSVMSTYLSQPARLIAKDGKYKVQMKLLSSASILSFQTLVRGSKQEAATVSTEGDTRTVEFTLDNPAARFDVYTHVSIPVIQYNNKYTVQVQLDLSDLPQQGNEPTPQPEPQPELMQPQAIDLTTGTYTTSLTAFKQNEDIASEMARYVNGTAKIKVENGLYNVSFTLKGSSMIPAFRVAPKGSMVDSTIVSEDAASGERVISFVTDTLESIVPAQVDVKVGTYASSYPVRLYLNPATIAVQSAGTDGLADGKYSASIMALKYGTSDVSEMDKYLGKPATVIKKSGKYTVQVKLNNSSWIKSFKVGGQEAQIVEQSDDTRVVQFAVSDLPKTIKINTHVIVPGLVLGGVSYDHTYDVDLKLGSIMPYEAAQLSATTAVLPLDFSTLSNGTYKLPFQIVMPGISAGTSTPLERFMATDQPVQLVVQDGTRHVIMKLNHGDTIKTLRVLENGTYTDAEILSSDEANNTKTIKFSVNDYTKNIPAQLVTAGGVSIASTIAAAALNEQVYDFEFKFDTAAVTADTATDEATTQGKNTIADGEYTTTYRIFKNGADTDSMLTPYVDRTAKLVAKQGKVQATITINNNEAVPVFMTDLEGKYTAPKLVSTSSDGTSRTVTFEVPDLNTKLSIFAHAQASSYAAQPIKLGGQIVFDTRSLHAADAGAANLSAQPEASTTQPVSDTTPATESATGSGSTAPASSVAQSAVKYSIGIKAYKDQSNELSVMNDYINGTATLSQENGQNYVQVTLNNGSWMPVLQVEQDGVLKDVERVASTGKTTVIRFKVDDLSDKINAYTHVVVPGLVIGGVPYDHWYTIQLQLDEASKKALN